MRRYRLAAHRQIWFRDNQRFTAARHLTAYRHPFFQLQQCCLVHKPFYLH
jgi:hypothetical protein